MCLDGLGDVTNTCTYGGEDQSYGNMSHTNLHEYAKQIYKGATWEESVIMAFIKMYVT